MFDEESPLVQCRKAMANKAVTVDRLLQMDIEAVAIRYGVTVDCVRWERERALKNRGEKPWELLKPKAPAQ